MNRADLQKIAGIRAEDANALLAAHCFDGAYYLAGYAVECALKSCIAKQVREHDFPDRKLVNDSYVHDLEKLLTIAGIRHHFAAEMESSERFAWNWNIVRSWSEERRYEHSIAATRARDFVRAVTEPTNGVLTWLKKYW